MTFKKTLNWTSHLQEAISSLNLKPMKVLNWISPQSARLPQNEKILKLKFYHDRENYSQLFKNSKPQFHIGDTVLVVKKPITVGYKGYKNNTLNEVEEISHIYDTSPITYGLKYGRRKYYADELRHYNESESDSSRGTTKDEGQPEEDESNNLNSEQQEHSPTNDQLETQPDYFVAETRQKRKNLRSGATHGEAETEYLLKSRSNPDFQLWISQEARQKLQNESKL